MDGSTRNIYNCIVFIESGVKNACLLVMITKTLFSLCFFSEACRQLLGRRATVVYSQIVCLWKCFVQLYILSHAFLEVLYTVRLELNQVFLTDASACLKQEITSTDRHVLLSSCLSFLIKPHESTGQE